MSRRCLGHTARQIAPGSTSRLARPTLAPFAPSPRALFSGPPAVSLPGVRAANVRSYSSPTLKFKQSNIPVEEYQRLSDQTFDALTDYLEALTQEYEGEDADDFEVEYSSGVLNLRLAGHGTYVINKQPANKQIWFSSPTSGPKRFDYDGEQQAWFMLKDGEESNMRDLLNRELSAIFAKDVEVDLGER